METVINLYKPIGMTPLQAVEKFRKKNLKYKKEKISYPGRLDPMAQGILLLLVGDENKKMIEYMGLDKEYRAKILLGFGSDSYDLLGLAFEGKNIKNTKKFELFIKKILYGFNGKYKQKLPVYSSYKIKGKPLFYYARKGKLGEIKIPKKEINIKKITIENIYDIGSLWLLGEIKRKINKVEGDFRQKEILKSWNNLLKDKNEKFVVVEVIICCSSGTYIRAISNDFGERLGSKALLLNLIRTKVGKFDVSESRRLI